MLGKNVNHNGRIKHLLEIGDEFVGNVNKHLFRLVDIQRSRRNECPIAIVKDLTTDQTLTYGYKALCHLDITYIDGSGRTHNHI